MVHEILVLELTLISGPVVHSIPRFDANKRGVLAVWTPNANTRSLERQTYLRFALGILDDSQSHLRLVENHSIVGKLLLVEFPYLTVGLQFISLGLDTSARVADDTSERFHIVEENRTVHLVALSHTGEIECRMTANLEVHLLLARVLHRPYHIDVVVVEYICHVELEVVGIHFPCLRTCLESICHTRVSLLNHLEVHIACESMTRQTVCLAINTVFILP